MTSRISDAGRDFRRVANCTLIDARAPRAILVSRQGVVIAIEAELRLLCNGTAPLLGRAWPVAERRRPERARYRKTQAEIAHPPCRIEPRRPGLAVVGGCVLVHDSFNEWFVPSRH